MKGGLRELRDNPAPPQPREAIPTLRNGCKQLIGVAASLVGKGKMPWGCPTAGSPGTACHSRLPIVLPGCSSGITHVYLSAARSPAMPRSHQLPPPATPNHHTGNPNSSSPLTSWPSNP